MKIIDNNGVEVFRGDCKAAKAFFGDGTLHMEVYNEETDTVEFEETLTLTMVYEEPADDMQYLADTDWYVTREAETGKPIPVDVKAKRSEIRARN
jgi:hypothetical protein